MKTNFALSGLILLFVLSLNLLFAFDSTDVGEVIAENSSSEIRQKLEKAQKMRSAGIPLAICGAISAPTGIIMMATADIKHWNLGSDGLDIDSDGSQAYIGLVLITTGLIEMGAGALCIVLGSKKVSLYKAALEKTRVTYDYKFKSYGIRYSVAF